MMDRRRFIRSVALAAGGVSVFRPLNALGSRYQSSAGFFGVHSFIENCSDAVFIMRTNVDMKTNGTAIKQAALEFSRSVIVPRESGVPLTHLIPIKPNITCSSTSNTSYSLEYGMGIVTDPFFVEGVIEGMKELGISGNQFYVREVNCAEDFGPRGYTSMAERTGAEIRDMSAGVGTISENDLVWKDTPEGVYFRKIPYLWPINAPDSWLLNISKFKAHGMGITLCAKNLQGSIAMNYQAHCTAPGQSMGKNVKSIHLNPNLTNEINANFNRHKADGVPRWDKPGTSGTGCGLGMETWASRCLDNNSVTHAGLHIIEGIYGRDGNGFLVGPNPAGNDDNYSGEAWDYMTNIIIFGMNQFHVDIVGNWLAGHEPGNFGQFHMAKERGMSKTINPMNIPVYEWKADGSAILTKLTDFTRTPLKTYYLQRNYSGQTELTYHLCNETFTYPSETPQAVSDDAQPRTFVLSQNRPNPFNPTTAIEYAVPAGGNARLEVFNSAGQLVDVLVDGYCPAGSHMAVWKTSGRASGVYYYRFRFGDFTETRKMTLLK